MLQFVTFWFIAALTSTYGHNAKSFRDDANLQSDLMPQELNPEFTSDIASFDLNRRKIHFPEIPAMPLRPLLPPLPRIRRDTSSADNAVVAETPVTSIAEQVKQYSRVIACFVLVVSAAIEVVVYIIEAYQTTDA